MTDKAKEMIKDAFRWICNVIARIRGLMIDSREERLMLENFIKYEETAGSLGIDDPLFKILELTNKGRMELEAGNADSALELLQHKHSLVLKIFGDDSPSSGTSFIDIGEAYLLANKRLEARDALEKAYSLLKGNKIYKEQIHRRLEPLLIEVSALQGHSDRVLEIGTESVNRLKRKGTNSDFEQAVALDKNAALLERQGKFNEALPLAKKALEIFERTDGDEGPDTGLCCLYIARIYRGLDKLTEAIAYGRRALHCAEVSSGYDSDQAAIKADELAQSLAIKADKDNDSVLASEAVEFSRRAHEIFKSTLGEKDKETLRCIENRKIILQMLQRFLDTEEINALQKSNDIALPTYCFISHSYADDEALNSLLGILPEYVKPVVFEPIQVNVTEFVSDKLINGVLGADGLLFIDSNQSNQSFWTAFERDLAIRNNKSIYAFNPITNKISHYERYVPKLNLAHHCHPEDNEDVGSILRWLVNERSFELTEDPGKAKKRNFLSISSNEIKKRQNILALIKPQSYIYISCFCPSYF